MGLLLGVANGSFGVEETYVEVNEFEGLYIGVNGGVYEIGGIKKLAVTV